MPTPVDRHRLQTVLGEAHTSPPEGRVWYLRRLNLFEGMTDEEIESVSHMLRDRRCAAGERVWDRDPDRLYLLKEGRVRLYRTAPDGQETTTAVLRPGQLFGLGGLFGRADEGMAEAVEPSVVCDASATHFLRVLAQHPLLMARVTMTMARQIFQLERTIEELSTRRVPGRVAAVLVELADESIRTTGDPVLSQSQTEIAKLVGTTRESVARAVGALRAEGVLAAGSPLRVVDLPRLRDVARDGS